ncbi:MAG: hypothetical protein ABMA64_07045 [Myxococcota bacterium]
MTPNDQVAALDAARARVARHLSTVLSTDDTVRFDDTAQADEGDFVPLTPASALDEAFSIEPPSPDPDLDLMPGFRGRRFVPRRPPSGDPGTDLRAVMRDLALDLDLLLCLCRQLVSRSAPRLLAWIVSGTVGGVIGGGLVCLGLWWGRS